MSDTAVTDPQPASQGEAMRIDYVARPGLLGLCFVNFLLGILTLGIYRFWARTNVRKHLWSCVHINGLPLEYTGRGIELFKGALVVFLVLVLPSVLLISGISIAYGPEHPAIAGVQLLFFLIVSLLWGAAIFRARRYQLSRTLWRGIRGGLEGSTVTYSLTYFGAMLARGASLGWTTPVMNLNLQEQIIGAMRFGDMPFSFKGRAGPLYPAYAMCWFLTLFAIIAGLVLFFYGFQSVFGEAAPIWFSDIFQDQNDPSPEAWQAILYMLAGLLALFLVLGVIYGAIWALYTAREMAAFANYTKIDKARFRLYATAGSLIGLIVGNFFIWLLTLGIATPFVQQRLFRYFCDRVAIDGRVDVDRILQSKAPLDSTGEGLADALDVGGF